ncbi:MAG: hypothetical protein IMX00_09665 [Limnochordales bacterium]|nr:hypothetical protein [Limnochordales bacterium]
MSSRSSPSRQAAPVTVQLDLDHPTGNFWIDNGLVALCNWIGAGNYPVEQLIASLQKHLLQKTGNKGEYWDEATGTIREYEKVSWVYPTNLFIRISGTAPKRKIGDKGYPIRPPSFELNLQLTKKQDYCDICGSVGPTADAKMWIFPFVVDPGKFGNFYSGAKRGVKLCPRCSVAGVAGYLGWLWVGLGRDAFHFFLFHTDLHDLARFHREVLQPLQVGTGRGGNVSPAFYGPYLHETTLGLLLDLFSHVRSSDRLTDAGRQFLASLLGARANSAPAPLTLYAITGKPGQAFNMQSFSEFSQFHSLYRFYEGSIESLGGDNPHRHFVDVFRQFQARDENQYNTIWRDRIARSVLEFSDPLPFVEGFLFEVRVKEDNPLPLVWGTEHVIGRYTEEVLSMDEEMLKVLSGFGYRLGSAAYEKDEMGIIYSLRNAKNPEDFFRVLNDIQFRLDMTIPEQILRIEPGERIANNPWVRVKTLLAIYAMNSYLRAGKSTHVNERGGNKE